MKFSGFLGKYPRYAKFNEHGSAEKLFAFLSQLEIVDRMITVNIHAGLSALDAVAKDVEQQFDRTPDFVLAEHLDARQMTGAMIKYILEPFGYVSRPENRISVKNSDLFRISMRYEFDPSKQQVILRKELRSEPAR